MVAAPTCLEDSAVSQPETIRANPRQFDRCAQLFELSVSLQSAVAGSLPWPGFSLLCKLPAESSSPVAEATLGVVIFRNARVANRFRYDTQAGSQDAIRAYNRWAS